MHSRILFSALLLSLNGCIVNPTAEDLQARGYKLLEVEEVFIAEGTTKQIAERATTCASRTLRFDPFQLGDAGSAAGIFSTGVGKQVIPGGDIIVSKDLDNGTVVANSRTPATFLLTRLMVQSTVTIDTKDGKYRIKHTNVENASSESGYSVNNGFQPVLTEGGSAKQVTKALTSLSKRLADCISSSHADKDF